MSFMDLFFSGNNSLSYDEISPKDGSKRMTDDLSEWISDDFLNTMLKSCHDSSNPIFDQFFNNDILLECGADNDPSVEMKCVKSGDVSLNDALIYNNSQISTFKEEPNENNENESCVGLADLIDEEEIEFEEVFNNADLMVKEEECESEATSRDDTSDYQLTNHSSDNSVSSYENSSNHFQKLHYGPRSRLKRSKGGNYSNTQRLHKYRKAPKKVYATLASEEQKLAVKEGIELPSNYPLTKAEERDLKRIRRKIRNKISAQDSRRRRKEYIDNLEERVERTTNENSLLKEKMKTLEHEKKSLALQVKKLRYALTRASGQSVQPGTCLFVLIMSLALIIAPNMRNSSKFANGSDGETVSSVEEDSTSLTSGHSRNLLFSENSSEGKAEMLSDRLDKMPLQDENVLTKIQELLMMATLVKPDSVDTEHDYFRPRKRATPENDLPSNTTEILNKMVAQFTSLTNSLVNKGPKNSSSIADNATVLDTLHM